MHPEDDPWANVYPDYVTCKNCADTYKNRAAFNSHLNFCIGHHREYMEKWPDSPRPVAEVITEAQVEETREDLVALLDELS